MKNEINHSDSSLIYDEKQYDKQKLEYNKQLAVSIVAWIVSISLVLYKHNKFKIIYNDLKDIGFTVSLIIVIIFSVYCWHSKNEKLKLSAEKASFGLIIAYLSRLDMVFAAYFIIFIFAFYAHDDII